MLKREAEEAVSVLTNALVTAGADPWAIEDTLGAIVDAAARAGAPLDRKVVDAMAAMSAPRHRKGARVLTPGGYAVIDAAPYWSVPEGDWAYPVKWDDPNIMALMLLEQDIVEEAFP